MEYYRYIIHATALYLERKYFGTDAHTYTNSHYNTSRQSSWQDLLCDIRVHKKKQKCSAKVLNFNHVDGDIEIEVAHTHTHTDTHARNGNRRASTAREEAGERQGTQSGSCTNKWQLNKNHQQRACDM